MNPCDGFENKTLRYLDDDLKGQELEDFLSHLQSCVNCRAHLEAEKALSQALHQCRPLYSAPRAVRDRIAAAQVLDASRGGVQVPGDRREHRIFGKVLPGILQHVPSWRILTPAAIVLVLCLAVVPDMLRHAEAASYIETAVQTHRNRLSGNLPSGLQSSSPEAVTAWFAGNVPFDFRLPTAESTPEKSPVYRLAGAALVNYKSKPAALIMYETHDDKISLLVDSSRSATVAGGDEVRFSKLTFHYYNDSGFRVITWSNHGLSYALVSSGLGPARASCMVCHENMSDHADFTNRD